MKRLIKGIAFFCLVVGIGPGAWAIDEEIKTDRKSHPVGAGVTDDANEDIKMIRIDPATGGILTKAVGGGAGGGPVTITDPGGVNQAEVSSAGELEVSGDGGADLSLDRILATGPAAVRQSDGTSFYKAADDSKFTLFDHDTGGGTLDRLAFGVLFAAPGGPSLVSNILGLPVNILNSSLANIETNTKTGQNATEPSVIAIGSTATLIFAANSGTREVFVQNAGTNIVFLGKSGVTTTTGVGIRGGSAANDFKGQSATITHGDDVYGIVSTGSENVRIQVVSD